MSDSFLRRWSRLKRQEAAPPAPPPAPQAPEPPEEIPPDAASIPLDEIAPWLRRRVPQAWRVAALRRLWVSDPAISGFVGLADYQFDWESLGGSPGWGPLRAIDDIAGLLSRAVGEPEPLPDTPEAEPASVEQVPTAALQIAAEPVDLPQDIVAAQEPPPPPPRRRGGGATPI